MLCLPAVAASQSDSVLAYVRIESGLLGLFGRGNEYARFAVTGRDVRLQDPTHVLLMPGVGLMVTYADRKDLPSTDLLVGHAQWEADYWRDHATKVDTATRSDLTARRTDVRVTELTLWNATGKKLVIELVGLRGTDGVFAFAVSPGSVAVDAMVSRLVKSLEVVHRPLTPKELVRVAQSVSK